jgi:tetratricopeptide (TPR) repeat protein
MIFRTEHRYSLAQIGLLAGLLLAGPVFAAGKETLEKARVALQQGDGIAAEVLLRDALHNGVPARELAARMGEAELLQGDYREAGRWLRPADFAPSERGHGYWMLGRLEMAQGNFTAAGRAFDQAIEEMPRNSSLWVDIGRFRYQAGEQFQAIEAADRALQIDSRDSEALQFKGLLVRDSQGFVAAIPIFAAALKQAPDNLEMLGEYAATLGEVGRARDMLVITRRMIAIDARASRAFYLQAVLAARGGQDDLARRLLWRTDDAFRRTPSAMLLSGVLELRAGNLETAAEILEPLWRKQPDNRTVALLIARMLDMDGRYAELVSRFSDLARRNDASPYLLQLVGRAYEALDRRGEAAFFLDRANALRVPAPIAMGDDTSVDVLMGRWKDAPGEPNRILQLIRQLLALQRFPEAQAIAGQVRSKFPDSSDVSFISGDVELMSGNPAGALSYYQQSARVRMSEALLDRMVAAELALDRREAAEGLLVKYFQQHPMSGSAAARIGSFALERQDWRRANIFLGFAVDHGGERDPDRLSASALALVKLNEGGAALPRARKAYLLQPGNSEVANVYGLVLEVLDHKAAAGELFKKAAMLSPGKSASP